ncbi:MAG: hypothetical protein M3Q08_00260 [Pseudomonadota bacterium]|nr:hypothetical protein [Pseudomonadota bacterium]
MSRNIEDRLARLRTRRKGTDRLERVATAARDEVLAKALVTEGWEKRSSKPHTRYALGAMEAVDAEGTKKSVDTAVRVGRQLEKGLSMSVTFRLQGSVPLDVHIRGVSDVDLLTIDLRMLTYASAGPLAGQYARTTLSSMGCLIQLRGEAEKLLKAAYPAATVDCSGGKCIALSGGSLERPVDVVPSHWFDTVAYQASRQEHDRGVTILNKKVPTTIDNLPFLHIKRVHDADATVLGGLKKAIRLTKNVKNDADDQTNACKLPSFDIAALLYHADRGALLAGYTHDLAILHETQRFLDWAWRNQAEAKLLRTPDGSRAILDTPAKFDGLLAISLEMDDLANRVAAEQVPVMGIGVLDQQRVRKILREASIPKAA